MLSSSDLSVNNLLNPVFICQHADVSVHACVLSAGRDLPSWLKGLDPDAPIEPSALLTDASSSHKFARLLRIRGLYGIHAACLHVSVRHKDYLGKLMLLSSQNQGWVYDGQLTLRSLATKLPKPTLLATSDPGVFLWFDTKLYLD